MTDILIGAFVALIVIAVFVVGFYTGYDISGKTLGSKTEESKAEKDAKERARQDEVAFNTLMTYNADVAYGRTKMEDVNRIL